MTCPRSIPRLSLGIALALAGWLSSGFAQSRPAPVSADPEVIAAEAWIGRALIVRGFPASDDLKYDASGSLQNGGKTVDWTLAGFDLQKVLRRGDGELELDGVRVAIRYNPEQHIFERHPQKLETMKVRLAATAVQPALAAIFSVGIDPALQRSMPPCWSHYFIPSLAWPADHLSGQAIISLDTKMTQGLVYPIPEKKVEPQSTTEATQDHVRGTLQLRMEVDALGAPQRIVVRQPLGYGLDAKTVEAAERYRFRPGTKDGVPAVFEFLLNQTFD